MRQEEPWSGDGQPGKRDAGGVPAAADGHGGPTAAAPVVRSHARPDAQVDDVAGPLSGAPCAARPDGRQAACMAVPLDILLDALSAASFDVERRDGPGSLRALCAFHRRDEAYVLHRKATLWAAETHEYLQVHDLPLLDGAAWERIRDGALAWGREQVRPHDEHMASYVSVIILCRAWRQDAADAVARCRVCKSFWWGLRGWMRLRVLALVLPAAPRRDTDTADAACACNKAARATLLPLVRGAFPSLFSRERAS